VYEGEKENLFREINELRRNDIEKVNLINEFNELKKCNREFEENFNRDIE
jgi:hypothetical protein